MDCNQICGKVSSNQLSYDEALRVVGYVEKVTNLLGIKLVFNTENFLNKCLDLKFTPEDAEELRQVLSHLQTRHQAYQQQVEYKNQARQQYSYSEHEEYRPRRKKGHHR